MSCGRPRWHLGQKTETNLYTREKGYAVCARLQGFGLAHEIEVSARELPLSNYSFRLSVHDIGLLKLLGEDVRNFGDHFQREGRRAAIDGD